VRQAGQRLEQLGGQGAVWGAKGEPGELLVDPRYLAIRPHLTEGIEHRQRKDLDWL
jgi:hypothetical protein